MFSSPKLIIAKLSKQLRASLDVNGEFSSSNSVFVLDSNSPYSLIVLAAIMNSTLMDYIYRMTFSGLNLLGSFQFQAPQIRILPIPAQINKDFCEQIEAKVSEIVDSPADSEIMNSLMAELDKLIYESYGLTDEEISIVENALQQLPDLGDDVDPAVDLELADTQ